MPVECHTRVTARVRGAPIFVALALLANLWLAPHTARAFDPGTNRPLAAAGTVEVAFSPWEDTEGLVLRAIRSAKTEIYVQAYLFTSRGLARALIEAKQRGVAVEVLADREATLNGKHSRIPQIAEAGIPVALEFRYAVAHNKIIVVDPLSAENAVVTGSYNFTYAAHAKNAENVLVLRNNPLLARTYYNNFLRHREGAIPYKIAAPAH
jgi:phosphatidylserine/phosphatidylglycerophosphate/cardiolipin synthase-like enzyme